MTRWVALLVENTFKIFKDLNDLYRESLKVFHCQPSFVWSAFFVERGISLFHPTTTDNLVRIKQSILATAGLSSKPNNPRVNCFGSMKRRGITNTARRSYPFRELVITLLFEEVPRCLG